VATRADIPVGVAKLSIQPDVQYNAQLINYHRVDGKLDHFLFVASHPATYAVSTKTVVKAVEADVLLLRRSRKGVPLFMDTWTGQVRPIGQFEEISDTEIKVHISLKAYQSCIITIAPLDEARVHAISTDAYGISREEDGLYLRSNETGSFTTKLSNGKSVTTKIQEAPAALELKTWQLEVQDWQPTEDIYSPETVITKHKVTLDSLAPWTSIPGLENVSGIGTYKTSFDLGRLPAHAGAKLEIPSFVGSMRIRVNGKQLPPVDQLDTDFEIGNWVRSGKNDLEIEVATNLFNRLRVADPEVYGVGKPQAYGLVGPVVLRLYVQVKIAK
jgi:hypothetical protein